jgi:PAS domain-containing protein
LFGSRASIRAGRAEDPANGEVMQQPIEVILMRELASHLATAIFVVDGSGNLEYYNEPAETLLGLRFDETGPMPLSEWATMFSPTDEHGAPLPPEGLPLVIALRDHVEAHGSFWIRGHDGAARFLKATAVPLVGQHGALVGAAAFFWEAKP